MSFHPPVLPPGDGSSEWEDGRRPRLSRKAVLALVLGVPALFCWGFVGGVPAVLLGTRARNEIDASGGDLTGRGLALTGVVCGAIGTVLSLVYVIMVSTGHGGIYGTSNG
jgi:hypothetical protein